MPGPNDLYDLCAEWLAVCEAAVATTEAGAIENTFVSPGPPVWDCEQLTVHAGAAGEADTAPLSPPLVAGQRDRVQGAVHLVDLTATVLRCGAVPDDSGNISIEELDATARKTNADVWAIWNVTRSRHKDGSLFPSPGATRELIFQPAISVAAEGGVYGWVVQARVALGGYFEEAP